MSEAKKSLSVLVEKYQCPGCVVGGDTQCGKYKSKNGTCESHVTGTTVFPWGRIAYEYARSQVIYILKHGKE